MFLKVVRKRIFFHRNTLKNLTKAKTNSGDADKAGFDLIVTGKYVNSSGKGKIGGESIADDAVIFVKDSAGKFSTMAGSDFANRGSAAPGSDTHHWW